MAATTTGSNALIELTNYLLRTGPRKILATSRRLRVIHNHSVIVDTTRAVHVWESTGHPQFFFPFVELQNCSTKKLEVVIEDGKEAAALIQINIPAGDGFDAVKTGGAIRFADTAPTPLAGMVRLDFNSMDQWLEEDSPIHVHPKDPFKRVDVLPSSRSVEIKVAGRTVAKSATSFHLFETGRPPRYYIPISAVDQSVIFKSDLVTKCPYKGEAEYYHIKIHDTVIENAIWYYRLPTHESAAIAGLVCFYPEKVEIILDGRMLERQT